MTKKLKQAFINQNQIQFNTLLTVCEKASLSIWISLFDVCIVDIDNESGITVLYNISGICPAFISVPLFDLRDDLNVNVILINKITNYLIMTIEEH